MRLLKQKKKQKKKNLNTTKKIGPTTLTTYTLKCFLHLKSGKVLTENLYSQKTKKY